MPSLDIDRALERSNRNGATSPSPSLSSTSLSHVHIADALKQSPDNGATLDLTHRNLTDVGESGAEELATIGREDIVEDESSVLRIALGYNRLATLPMAFALLSRLRYLNLKNNSFSVFPDVLTVMPSLEILDISRNKIKRLPSQPGSLTSLRVFCMSRNKLTRLPSYLSSFRQLAILKTDHNPLEWPPKSIMEPFGGVDDLQIMRNWIRTVQKWMEDSSPKTEGPKASDEPITSERTDLDNIVDDSIQSWSRFPILEREFDAATPHARSFSMDSEFSVCSITEAMQSSTQTSLDSPRSEFPPPLHLGTSPPNINPSSPSRSPDSYLPTLEAYTDEDATAVVGGLQQLHARNASYAGGSRVTNRSGLYGKKSLPDLRTAKLNFDAIKTPPHLPSRGYTTGPDLLSAGLEDGFSSPSVLSQKDDAGSSEGRPIPRPAKSFVRQPISTSPSSRDRPAPSMDVERNSYFRRLSTLPSSTISTAIPSSLLSLIDAGRSILFAVCQVYQTLQHYTVYAIDERLSSVLRKVLDPASTYMMQLINALDRFDSMSRRTLPPPTVCRSVIECCKDTVAVFGKAVGVLALQLKVLATHDDVRYLRQMLLVLYGATAEISHAWQAMTPHIDVVRPLLQEHRKPPVVKTHPIQSPNRQPAASSLTIPEPASASLTAHIGYSTMPRSHISQPPVANGIARTRTARRHAGSFSSKDVEIGKTLPSCEDMPQTPSLRPGLRQAAVAPSPTIGSSVFHHQAGLSSGPRSILNGHHSRQGSQASLKATSSSLSISTKLPVLELPPNSKTLVDKEALDAMRVAVEAAPAVWEMMDEILNEVNETQDGKIDAHDSLAKAKMVTERLKENIRAVQRGHPGADRKALREDAHVFVKTVVQLSNVIKTYGGAHTIFPDLRSRMVKLTNSTEEFVILLHVSSFSPSSTPRPYSPMPAGPSSQAGLLGAPDDSRLGPSLSRSRSAQPAASSKLVAPSRDSPRSALPTQSFNLPPIPPRLGVRNWDGGGDSADGQG